MAGKEVNRQELADFLGVSLPTITRKLSAGMPYVQKGGRGKEWVFNTADVLEFEKSQAVINAVGDTTQADADELKRRKLAAETSLAEIEAAKAKGEVVYIADAVKIITDDILAAKARLRNVAGRVVPQIIGETNETRLQEVIAAEIDYALDELANRFIQVEDEPSEAAKPGAESLGAAAKLEAVPVGRA